MDKEVRINVSKIILCNPYQYLTNKDCNSTGYVNPAVVVRDRSKQTSPYYYPYVDLSNEEEVEEK